MPEPRTSYRRNRQCFDLARDLGRQEAAALERSLGIVFRTLPVITSELARNLGIMVCKRESVPGGALLEKSVGPGNGTFTIWIERRVPYQWGKYAIAHEIGHFLLLKNHADLASRWELKLRESFADAVACEILVPRAARMRLAEVFRQIKRPEALVELASRFGVYPGVLLSAASSEPCWMRGLNTIWVRVSFRPNWFTGLGPRLRINAAHYDSERFFVPVNLSLRHFCGSDDWLLGLNPGEVRSRDSVSISLCLKQLSANNTFTYPRVRVTGNLAAMRFADSPHPNASPIILMAQLEMNQE